jgi:hypothetical protein
MSRLIDSAFHSVTRDLFGLIVTIAQKPWRRDHGTVEILSGLITAGACEILTSAGPSDRRPGNIEMRLARFAAAFLLLILAGPGMARADDAPLYHVTETTVACADETSVRNLTNPTEVRRSNNAWYKATFDSGRCVSVTPKSPWRFVSRDNDVVMMDYAGTVGPPGSYYFNAAQLVDPNGNHPGDTAAPVGPAAGNAPSANPSSAETALAPNAQPTSPAPENGAEPTWGVTNVLLLAVALLLAAIVGFLVGRRGPRV